MKQDEAIKAAALGFFAGVTVAGLLFRKFVREMAEEDARITNRNVLLFDHMIETMGPYVPPEVLKENLDFAKFQTIIMHEEPRK